MKRGLFAELRRRNVIRAAVFYVGAVWALTQGIAQLTPVVGAPEWVARWFLVAAVIGFPFLLAVAWFYELTPDGLKRESEVEPHESITHLTGRKLDFAIIGVLAIVVVLLLTDRFVLRHGVNTQAAIPAAEHSIAVLPFVNMSSDKEQEFFSDGISEELLNLLARIPQLKVTARTSSFSFKGKDVSITDIARTLRVAYVLEGSVRKAGDSVRITAQLIRAGTDTHVWSQAYDRKLDDIFAIQDEIAADVVKQLRIKLLGEGPKVRATDPEAYAFYLQAVQLGRLRTAVAYDQADVLYRKVLEIDPRYAPAWSGLANSVTNRVNLGLIPLQEGYAQARDASMKALAIDENYAPAHARLGVIAMYGDGDLAAAARHFERALALDSGALNTSALLLQSLGRLDEALAVLEVLVRRDPVNVSALFNRGLFQRYAGRLDDAAATYRTVLSLVPGRGNAHAELGIVLLLQGDAPGALAQIEQETSDIWKAYGLPMAYHALGRDADSDTALAALIARYGKEAPYNIAYVHAFRGDADQAFAWLETAAAINDSGLADVVSENLFDNVRADARWLPFLRKIGKTPEQLAKIEFTVPLPGAGSDSADGSGPAANSNSP